MEKIRLLLIEKNRLLREGLAAILKNHKDISIVATSGDNENTILKLHQLKPNVILLDLNLRSQNSLHVVSLVKKEFPKAKVVVMDLAPVHGDVVQYVKAGASGFILKDTTLDDFIVTIRRVAEGGQAIPPTLAESLFSRIVEHAIKGKKMKVTEPVRMTKPEKAVFGLIGKGLSDKEIGQKLHFSVQAIRTHLQNIMKKLTLHNRLEVRNYEYTDGTLETIVGSISVVGS
jgi:DNA-binding NarL/FixJ family response regulator